jgi:hypothetical protein
MGITMKKISGLEIFVHKHMKRFLGIGQTSEASHDL